MSDIKDLQKLLRDFAAERDWDQFHSPKNLAMALSVEASELLEHFQWLSEAESASLPPDKLAPVAEEMADVFLYLLRMADKMGVDLVEQGHRKIVKNRGRYPADKVRGSSKKYSEY
ncbi:nucleotide pyrophosphohydrolase [Pseudomaricurvus alcaniphilus]|uniref:nucleotide pyrophosphohydrolase n=1 Tax=Pseudomaricurvus alcaniphilus TaxID=1166482 RepID=UPI003C7DCC0F